MSPCAEKLKKMLEDSLTGQISTSSGQCGCQAEELRAALIELDREVPVEVIFCSPDTPGARMKGIVIQKLDLRLQNPSLAQQQQQSQH